ncbi:unnamed protein product [Staurois parvus]|uniref:Peroxiredoxin-5 n=1 Tax=Staurois parvus TaxID=386267 RepID=A0ABN9D9H1_9NEOB|nr:unnamed protein product [Staurois parvus]
MTFRLPVSFRLLSSLRTAVRSRAMSIKVGDPLPDAQVFDGSPENQISVKDVFGSEKGILFGVPGAFTPGCTKTHLPGYVSQADDLKSRGVKVIACISVNDAFVMNEWGKCHGADGKVRMLADPTGNFVKVISLYPSGHILLVITTYFVFMFSLIVEGGKVKAINVEEDGTGLTCSLAANILSQL